MGEVLAPKVVIANTETQLRNVLDTAARDCRRDVLWESLRSGEPGMASAKSTARVGLLVRARQTIH
jgi:hypothetical protein